MRNAEFGVNTTVRWEKYAAAGRSYGLRRSDSTQFMPWSGRFGRNTTLREADWIKRLQNSTLRWPCRAMIRRFCGLRY